MALNVLFFIYGLLVMFYGLMSWMFWRRGSDMLSRMVSVLMMVIFAESVKDLFIITDDGYWQTKTWQLIAAIDMVVVPIYTSILRELVSPGSVTWKRLVTRSIPFVVTPLCYWLTELDFVYYVNIALAGIYGLSYTIWAVIEIPKYSRWLKKRYSYSENVNLRWLRIILYSFWVILILWLIDCFIVNVSTDGLYLLGSLGMWMAISYFISRHESVLEEFSDEANNQEPPEVIEVEAVADENSLASKIEHYFKVEKGFLNSRLKLSDVASAVGSNRSYVSHYFNQELGSTFFDYVNNLRIEYACELLKNTNDSIDSIAMSSGFNSPSTFYRVFQQVKSCTPSNFRGGGKIV